MDEDLQSKLLSYLNKIEAVAGRAEDFASTEIPETIKEWLRWQMIDGCVTAAAMLVLGLLVPLLLYRLNRFMSSHLTDRDDRTAVTLLLSATSLISITPFYWSFQSAKDAAKVYYAPRVVIVEKVAELVKTAKR